MITRYLKSAALMLLTVGLVAYSQTPAKKTPSPNDVKIRQRMGPAGGGVETVLYIKGSRMRSEIAGSNFGMTTILQCDLKRTLTIYEKTKTYLITPADGTNAGAGTADGDGGGGVNQPAAPAAAPRRGGVVNVTNTITDTGERKEMFGFTARRIKTSLVKTASPDACDKDQKVETDGWYIDFQYAFECPGQTQKIQPVPVRPQPRDCQDEVRTKTSGTGKLGFPLLVTTTIYRPDGKTTTSTQEVLELSREPLSAALFETPEGYTLAKNMQELYGMNASASAAPSYSPPAKNSNTSSSAATSASTATDNAGPKKAGVIRVGLVLPKVQLSAGNAAQAAEALRNDLASYLKTPNVEAIALSARAESAVMDEARQRECDYVLYVSMSVKKSGGGMFGRAVGNIAGSVAGQLSGKNEVTLEYKLEPMDRARQKTTNTFKAKTSSDGEDVRTALVEKASGAVLATVTQKQ